MTDEEVVDFIASCIYTEFWTTWNNNSANQIKLLDDIVYSTEATKKWIKEKTGYDLNVDLSF